MPSISSMATAQQRARTDRQQTEARWLGHEGLADIQGAGSCAVEGPGEVGRVQSSAGLVDRGVGRGVVVLERDRDDIGCAWHRAFVGDEVDDREHGIEQTQAARVSASVAMNVEDYYQQGKRSWFRL